MTFSAVQICNRALDILGADPVLSLTDNSEAGRLCNRNFAPVRDAVLRAYPWNAAMRRAALPALAEPPSWGFAAAYQLPVDCLRLWRVENEDCADWRVEGRTVVTDMAAPCASSIWRGWRIRGSSIRCWRRRWRGASPPIWPIG